MFSSGQRTAQEKDSKLMLAVNMETRHPAERPFGCEFSAFVIIAKLWRPAWSRKTCKF